MNEKLLAEFAPASKEEWIKQVLKDLKGKDFDQTLVWQAEDGLAVQPFYTTEDLGNLPVSQIQETQVVGQKTGWQNREQVKYATDKDANQLALNALQGGADELAFDMSQTTLANVNLSRLLDKIKLSDTPVTFHLNHQTCELVNLLKKTTGYPPKGSINDDPLSQWMNTGHWHADAWTQIATAIRQTKEWPNFRVLTVNSHHFHNAGASASQELALTLAAAVTYIDKLIDEGIDFEEVISNLAFSVSIGTNYFMEIAKLRALRYLWSVVSSQWAKSGEQGAGGQEVRNLDSLHAPRPTPPTPCPIHAQTSTFYDSALSPNNNLLRATTEAMAAATGGCYSLTVHPYQSAFSSSMPSDEFSRRIARNVSHLMKNESHLDKTLDPAAGSYYLENLTASLANSAWALLLKIEALGGLIEAFKGEFIQNEIEKTFNLKLESLKTGSAVMVGVNKFRFDETAYQKPEIHEMIDFGKSGLKLLPNRRISEIFE